MRMAFEHLVNVKSLINGRCSKQVQDSFGFLIDFCYFKHQVSLFPQIPLRSRKKYNMMYYPLGKEVFKSVVNHSEVYFI